MKCIYNKKIPCEINPNGPMTKDFVCLKCHKPGKEPEKQRVFNRRGKFSSKRRSGCGRK